MIDKGWIEANELSVGDKIITRNGNAYVKSIMFIKTEIPVHVFNIEVENNDNYQIQEMGVVVVDRWNAEAFSCKP